MKGLLAVMVLVGVTRAACGGSQETPAKESMPMPAPAAQVPPAGNAEITLTTQPDPPKMGETTFEAMVMMGGQPVTDADVSVELFMPAMPSMNMAEMRTNFPLKHEGGGRYRGPGKVMMAGNWDATVSVKQDGKEIGTRKVPVVAK